MIGDAAFAVDGALVSRANANRDLFRNSLAWLAGLDAATASARSADVLATGMDRSSGARFIVFAVFALPSFLFILGSVFVLRRRLKA